MSTQAKTLYQSLEISETASPIEIQKAFRRLAMEFHPDRNPGDAEAEARFKEIAEAHAVLNDPDWRKRYDETGEIGSTVNRAMAILLTQVSAALSSAMNKLAAKGESANEVDVVQVMRDDIKNRKVEVQKGLYHLGRVRDNLEKVKGRFQTEGADNVFEKIVEAHLGQIQAEVKIAESELKKADELLAFLNEYTFKKDLKNMLWNQVNCTPWKL